MGYKPVRSACVTRLGGALRQAADLCRSWGKIMTIKRISIIPAILALSTAGSILAGSAATVLATTAPAAVTATAAARPAHIFEG
jgi:hypothetical protein